MSLLCCQYSDTIRPVTKVTVGRQNHVDALFDSGAEATLLSLEHFNCLSRPPRLTRYQQKLKTANGTEIKVIGQASLEYEIASKKMWHPTVIVEGLNNPCIIGADFMEQHGITIDFSRKKIVVERSVPNQKCKRILLTSRTRVCAGMTKSVQIKSEGGTPMDTLDRALFIQATTKPLVIEDCLVTMARDGGTLVVRNTTNETIELPRGTEVSQGFYVKDEHVVPICSLEKTPTEKPELKQFKQEIDAKLKSVPRMYINQYRRVLTDFADVFSTNPDDVGSCGDIKQTIRLIDENKVSSTPPYRLPHHLLPIAHEYVKKLLRLDIIRPSTSPFSSPLMLVKKAGVSADRPITEQYRVVHDYR